jgi:hypothetical protein
MISKSWGQNFKKLEFITIIKKSGAQAIAQKIVAQQQIVGPNVQNEPLSVDC